LLTYHTIPPMKTRDNKTPNIIAHNPDVYKSPVTINQKLGQHRLSQHNLFAWLCTLAIYH
jgi:hypothetical protein